MQPQAIIFDKDGTLFDFEASWSGAMQQLLVRFAPNDDGTAAKAVGFDPETGKFHPDSVAIAGTAEDIGRVLSPAVGQPVDTIIRVVDEIASDTTMVPVVDLVSCLGALREDCPLAVVTNDSYEPAERHISEAGLGDLIEVVLGFDSGHGVKPGPGPLLACAEVLGTEPSTMLMVGDSLHDLQAGRAAGMRTVGVLTGIADAAELSAFADVVLPDIGHLKQWIADASTA